eukprot:7388354-Alexandrium_andersonii.AAC.1
MQLEHLRWPQRVRTRLVLAGSLCQQEGGPPRNKQFARDCWGADILHGVGGLHAGPSPNRG